MSPDRLVFGLLRYAAAACFIGHGAFGIITKKDWLRFFEIVGIQETLAYQLMPWIGTMDISLGLAILFFPLPLLFGWMTFWALWTAACRPLSGLSIWEFFERAGNYGVPFTLLLLCRTRGQLTPVVTKILRITTALLLVGHGGFYAFVGKPMLIKHWASVGINLETTQLLYVGLVEFALAAAALFTKNPLVFAGIVFWKFSNELLYPISGSPWWEFIERAGSYGAPFALYVISLAALSPLGINAPSDAKWWRPAARASRASPDAR